MRRDEEYPIESECFAQALREQRAMRLKGGLYHLNQVLMAYNTNRIEGSLLDEDQTRYIYETRTVTGDAVRVDDVVETMNSFELFDVMIDSYDAAITAETLKNYHRILKTGTAHARADWFAVGDWKRVANVVGGMRTTPPEHVALAVEALLERTPPPGQMTFAEICDFHHAFEAIHPFQDGNGRVGRIVMFQQCLQNGVMPFIVLDAQKEFYYRGLAEYANEPGFLRETFRSFQDAYYERFAELVPGV
ncbi:Fic family protein [Leucobacter sp. W1038]|uniref:Fic family protein n=1 Tax=Leucobacter sp. W1038 TaxID=3438281 RepID=UPI003D985F82